MSLLSDRLNSLTAMKQSPYYKAFENDATRWEEKLNKASTIFNVFIDVQRRWIYLEGVFNNSADVQQLLATQFNRFRTFDREFVKLTRSMKAKPDVDFWVHEDKNLLSRLEEYANILNSIQKALGQSILCFMSLSLVISCCLLLR